MERNFVNRTTGEARRRTGLRLGCISQRNTDPLTRGKLKSVLPEPRFGQGLGGHVEI